MQLGCREEVFRGFRDGTGCLNGKASRRDVGGGEDLPGRYLCPVRDMNLKGNAPVSNSLHGSSDQTRAPGWTSESMGVTGSTCQVPSTIGG